MRCGGEILRMYEPEDTRELEDLLKGLGSYHVLGSGTNTIFADTPIPTPVIRLGRAFDFLESSPGGVRAGGATSMRRILAYCIRNGLTGIEFMAGIPGTLGGALSMNAGTRDRGIMDAVDSIEIADPQGHRTIRPRDIPYGYRTGGLPRGAVVTACVIRLEPSDPEEVRRRVLQYMEKRRGQPRGPSSGSIFRNPAQAPAGLLIDRAGLKGLRVGGAKVSEVHANFIVNDGGASASDVMELIERIKGAVRTRFGIELEEEVRIIGH